MFFPKDKLFLIAGPCVIENEELCFEIAEKMIETTKRLGIPYIFKASFDKANRSSIHSFRGVGLSKGLEILAKVKKKFSVPVTSDVHTPEMIAEAASVLDVVQIPAFLARQTDFFVEAGKAKVAMNVKKGQFMSPHEMKNAVEKYRESGGTEAAVTERGTTFGYGNLVVDFRSIPILQNEGLTYIFDATHSLQLPAARGSASGGDRKYIPTLARAQVAAGANGIFMEVHPDPAKAMSDKETQWPLYLAESLLSELSKTYALAKTFRDFQKDL